MPRLIHRKPSYRKHKATGLAVVTIDGVDRYLGKYETATSKAEYQRLIAEWEASSRKLPLGGAADGLTIVELINRYWRFCEGYYVKNSRPTTELACVKESMRPLRELYGRLRADEFGPLKLKAVREAMISNGWARSTINGRVLRIRKMFKWAVENEILPASNYEALRAVAGLRKGRSLAPEPARVRPVAEEHVQKVLPYLAPQVAAMVQLQLLTGMRSGEVTAMQAEDIDMAGAIWEYRPKSHKTEHHDLDRVVPLGPLAQDLIRPFLTRDVSAYLFSPIEAEASRLAQRHARRITPFSCGNRPGKSRKRLRLRPPGERYEPASYARAIVRGCDAAFPTPDGARQDEIEAWHRAHRFHPHQARHTAATRIRKQYGLEAAKCVLDHTNIETTQIYAEMNHAKAAEIMARVG